MLAVTLLSVLLPVAAGAATAPRLALVIGNADYTEEASLVNTLNDARDMAERLEALGFEVMRVENASRRELARAANEFKRRLRRADDSVALFYYSGHGLQVNGENFLVPVDAQISDELDVPTEGLSVNRILAGLGERSDKALNLVILDACRNNPYETNEGTRSIGDKGLARVKAPGGTLILYATRPDETASDNPNGRNGLFTEHLLAEMSVPGVSVEQVFKRAAERVFEGSGRRQDPWMEGRIRGEFYFVPALLPDPPSPPPPPPPSPPSPPPPVVQPNMELEVWRAADDCATQLCLQAYLDTYPRGVFAAIAQARIAALTKQPAPVVVDLAADAVLQAQLEQCAEHLAAKRLTTGKGGTAWDCYREVLAQDPGNAEARKGLDAIVSKYVQWGRTALSRGEIAKARGYLKKATAVQAESPQVAELAEAIAQQEAVEAQMATPRRSPAIEPKLVPMPGGSFWMGSPDGEPGRAMDERRHQVNVGDFKLSSHEVTVQEFQAFVEATGYRTDAEQNSGDKVGCFAYQGGSDFGWTAGTSWRNPGFAQGKEHPVVCVSWNDAQAYIEWLNEETEQAYRLPREAEWEYAARAGSSTRYGFGDAESQLCAYGNVADSTVERQFVDRTMAGCDDEYGFTAPVGQFQANAFQLHDMHGNVWEWTCSAYDEGYGGAERQCLRNNEANDRRLVFRGGAWINGPRYVRSTARIKATADYRSGLLGFRLAQD